jgi:phage shock protein C
VCARLADRFGIARGLVRVSFGLFGLFGVGELACIIPWILIPEAP